MDVPTGTVLLDSLPVVNHTGVPTADVFAALEEQDRGLYASMRTWAARIHEPMQAFSTMSPYGPGSPDRRAGNLWQRDRYVMPVGIFDQMRLARSALDDDDIVSGVAEITESLTFSAISFFAVDPDEQDVYNQIAADIDLDSRLREIWRELYTVSQCYIAVTRKPKTYKVRGTTKGGNQRRKEYRIVAPNRVVMLDALKVVPVGSPYGAAFSGTEGLAYIATRDESLLFEEIASGAQTDEIVSEIVLGRYTPSRSEAADLGSLGINTSDLWLLDPNKVFRHTFTKPGYRRLAQVRMKGVFELLDMKHQLREMERSHVVAGSNFIIVITKGTDAHPAKPSEVQHLQAQVQTNARVPILVGDHRLNVEIVTPKLDNTLRPERWNTIDSRIAARLYGLFFVGNYQAGAQSDDSIKLVKVLARGLESRRHMIRRSLERHIFGPLYDGNEALTTRPKLQFHPRSISLDFDAAWASFLFDLRQSREISRETTLNQFDLSQELEAIFMEREHEEYDAIFQTQVPFSTPNPANQPLPKDNGGGRSGGGGAAPGTGQGELPRGRPARPTAELRTEPEDVDVTLNDDRTE
jgi:hypothetical protein